MAKKTAYPPIGLTAVSSNLLPERGVLQRVHDVLGAGTFTLCGRSPGSMKLAVLQGKNTMDAMFLSGAFGTLKREANKEAGYRAHPL